MMMERTQAIRRLWNPRVIAGVSIPLALGLIASYAAGSVDDFIPAAQQALRPPAHIALVLVAAILAIYAVRTFVRALNDYLDDYLGLGRARSLSTFSSVVLYAIIILFVVGALGRNLSGVLVGGALTGVVVGIAGQASLSNVIAGLVILFARPYSAGMFVTARTGSFGGVEYSGQVWDISLFYTTLRVNELEVRIPNSAMINAVVVQRPREYDVFIPVTLPKATTGVPAVLDRLRAAIENNLEGVVRPRVTLDSITDAGYVVGIRAYVTDDAGRRAIETAIADIVSDVVDAVTQALAPVADNKGADGKGAVETREDSAASVEHDRHAGVAARAR